MSGDEAYQLTPRLFDRGIRALLRGAEQASASRAIRLAEIHTLEGQRPWGGDQIGQAFDTNYTNSPFVADTKSYWAELVRDLTDFADGVDVAEQGATAANDAADQQVKRSQA